MLKGAREDLSEKNQYTDLKWLIFFTQNIYHMPPQNGKHIFLISKDDYS